MAELVGYKQLNFTGQGGEVVNGTNLFFADASDSVGLVGRECFRFFVSEQKIINFPKLDIGGEYDLVFNRFGKLQNIIPL